MSKTHVAIASTIAALALAVATPASAKNKKNRKEPAAKTASKKKAKSFDFEADEIDASRIRPDGTAIFGRPPSKHDSLIKYRSEFIAHIVKSAERL